MVKRAYNIKVKVYNGHSNSLLPNLCFSLVHMILNPSKTPHLHTKTLKKTMIVISSASVLEMAQKQPPH